MTFLFYFKPEKGLVFAADTLTTDPSTGERLGYTRKIKYFNSANSPGYIISYAGIVRDFERTFEKISEAVKITNFPLATEIGWKSLRECIKNNWSKYGIFFTDAFYEEIVVRIDGLGLYERGQHHHEAAEISQIDGHADFAGSVDKKLLTDQDLSKFKSGKDMNFGINACYEIIGLVEERWPDHFSGIQIVVSEDGKIWEHDYIEGNI